MKKLSTILIIFVLSAVSVFAEIKVAPYYSLNISEGLVIPNKGDSMFSLNLTNDIGLLVQPAKDSPHRILGFYELKYAGPGLHKQEGEKFSDRWMDHISMLRYNYNIDKYTSIKLQADYMTEYKRTGTNEVWGKGLYDFNRTGFVLGVSRTFFQKLGTELNFGVHSLDFPNYTDLLREFQSSGENADSAAGKQNHTVTQTGLVFKYADSKVNFDSTNMAYAKQKVITETKQADNTFYSSTLQKDTIFSFGFEHNQRIFSFLVISPSANMKLKASNQNYQHFETATSTVPVRYFSNYYAYTEYGITLPCSLLVASKWELFYTLEYSWKNYNDRPPRDTDGNFITGKQQNTLSLMSTGITFKPNDITRTTLFYTYQSQASNMKYEKYLPYNYDGHYIGINFNYTY